MPQNKQMKIQWVTIDGKNVPFVLPQVWDPSINDWRITSDDYPLPTKDDLLLQKIEDLNNKVDGIIDGTTPANTRLTGSIVELASGFNDITISAGSTINLLSSVNLIEQGFTKVCVVIRMAGQLRLHFVWRDLSSPGAMLRLTERSLTAGLNGNDVEANVLSNHLNVAIVNSSNEDDGVIIRAMILGVR